jgi:hypothetical protein
MATTYLNQNFPLQVVENTIPFPNGTYLLTSAQQTYQLIPNTTKSFQIKQTGSTLVLQAYVCGYSSNSNGTNMTFRVNGVLYGTNGGSGDTWSRAHNGWSASMNIGRILTINHGLTAGSTCTVELMGGVWSSGSTYFGYPGYNTYMGWVAMEMGV